MVISNRGCISGTVLGPDGQAFSGAIVAVGSQQAVTDARGRFRIILWGMKTRSHAVSWDFVNRALKIPH
jgi:hypothetical protein